MTLGFRPWRCSEKRATSGFFHRCPLRHRSRWVSRFVHASVAGIILCVRNSNATKGFVENISGDACSQDFGDDQKMTGGGLEYFWTVNHLFHAKMHRKTNSPPELFFRHRRPKTFFFFLSRAEDFNFQQAREQFIIILKAEITLQLCQNFSKPPSPSRWISNCRPFPCARCFARFGADAINK